MHVFPNKKYKKSLKKVLRSGKVHISEIDHVIDLISSDIPLPAKYQDHGLLGSMEGYRECHIQPDLLLIYQIRKDILVLVLINIGSHSELFK